MWFAVSYSVDNQINDVVLGRMNYVFILVEYIKTHFNALRRTLALIIAILYIFEARKKSLLQQRLFLLKYLVVSKIIPQIMNKLKNTKVGKKLLTYKRRIVTEAECRHDLRDKLDILLTAFWEAVIMYEGEVVATPPEARPRGFEASLMQAKMIQSFQKHFPESWRFGKYKRFILDVNGYVVLVKKLNAKDMPMNIKTQHATHIANQLQLSLFGEAK